MRLCVVLLAAALGCLSQQTAGKPIGMEDTIADVVSRILEGSDKAEKTEAITLVLQLLTEIDLPSLCKSIGDDPTEMTSVDDIVARAATARHTEATTAPVMDTDVDLAEQNNTNMNWKTDSTSTLDVAEKEFTSTDEALEETKDDMTEAASKEVELNAEVEINLPKQKQQQQVEVATEAKVTTTEQPTEKEIPTIEVATEAKVTTVNPHTEKEITTMEAKGTTVEQPTENEITTIEVATEAKVTTVDTPTEEAITTTTEVAPETEISTITESFTEGNLATKEAHTDVLFETKEQTATEDILPTETHNPATSMPSESSLSYDAWNVDDSTDYIARIKSLYDDYLHVPDYTSSRLLPPNPGYDYFDLTDNLIYDIAAAAETSKTDVLHRLEQALHNGNEEMLHFPDSILTLNSLASQLKPEDDIVYIEESKSLKPKPVLSSENFQREEGLPLDSQMVLQEPQAADFL
ncbi:hypothetical protein C0Q70_04271 [Pomacea canaliculata]|uniref:Uncharacterized protein n=1 Tax=Pomacea canaliculata TaxID=400727 RepID=A0A2T7PV20_POMCA|nr:hypothetical protein C0Q70_04271 [Pomacea canaliculata]